MRDLKELVDAARKAAARAADHILSSTPPPASEWTVKNRNDFVTEVDREAERLITEILQQRVPGSVVVGEELNPKSQVEADVVWIVDPLDGTTNFLHGYPQYAVSIGARVDGQLAVGVVQDVRRNLVYHGATCSGAWLGERRISVSNVSDPARALIGTGFPFKHQEEIPRFLEQLTVVLTGSSGVRRAGAAALDLADIAAGRLDGFWELSLAPWDVAGGAVLVREAGGVITTLDGSDDILSGGSIVAGAPAIHQWLKALSRIG